MTEIMSVNLCSELFASDYWKQVKDYSEQALEKSNLTAFTVNIRAATDEEEGVIVTADRSVNCKFNGQEKTLDFIIGRGENESPLENPAESPKRYAEIQIVDTLDQFVQACKEGK